MHIILLNFGPAKDKAGPLMEAHKAWIAKGFEDGVFVFVGTITGGRGGVLMARSQSRESIEARVADDPFVAEGVVEAEILEVSPGRVDERLALLAQA